MAAGIITLEFVLIAMNLVLVLCNVIPLTNPNNITKVRKSSEASAIAGRAVSVPAKIYKQAFKAPKIKLGQCPLVMEEGNIKTCKDEFEGEEVYLPKGSMTVDVSRVQSSEDVMLHVMGGVGGSIGVLGLVSVAPKVKVAVTTDTSRNSLNFMSSYEASKGVITLHDPRPKHVEGERVLFLSEIELGGNELFLVTLEFESEDQKVEVEVSVAIKIVFISITAKLNYINQKFKSKASCRIQFKSSWREDQDIYFSSLGQCIPKVKEIEDQYMNGPHELKNMSIDDERAHYFYYFSSWQESPYGSQFNLALINHDLQFLGEQNVEIKAVLGRINKLRDRPLPVEVRKQMEQLNQTLTVMTEQLMTGLNNYHNLEQGQRHKLRDIYGKNKAPQYYSRYLERILS